MELNYKTFGAGEPLIIIHGLFGMLDNWQTIAKKLSDTFMVYTVDMRNHGRSPHLDDHSYPLMANDIKAWMESEGILRANVLGHSMGGKAAMQLAHDYPELVEKLIVVDIAPKEYSGGHETIIEALNAVPIDTVTSRSEVEDILRKYIDQRGVILFLMKNLTRKKEGGFRWKMNLPVLSKYYRDKIMAANHFDFSIDAETMFIKGGNSNYITAADEEAIQAIFDNVSLVEIPDAGHWVHADQPGILIETLTTFLSGIK